MSRADIINMLISYLRKHRVKEASLFGSFTRGDMHANSDIDILVEYERGTTLFDIVRMRQELHDLIGRKVDLVSKRAVNKRLLQYIQPDLQLLFRA